MNNKRTRTNGFRPLLLVSAVGMACQSVMAQSVAELSATPFANRPLHLQNDTSISEIKGVNPNVMFFIDDSGSMQALVGGRTEYDDRKDRALRNNTGTPWCDYWGQWWWDGRNRCPGRREYANNAWDRMVSFNYANPEPCEYNERNLGTTKACYHTRYPHRGFFTFRQPNNRIQVTIDALNRVVDRYQDQWNWNIYTLWGSEARIFNQGISPDSPQRHSFMTAAQVKSLINGLSPRVGTPTTQRYIDVTRIMRDSIEYRCQKSYIIVMSDGEANSGSIPGLNDWERRLYGSFSIDGDSAARYMRTPPGGGGAVPYRTYEGGVNNGISLFSQALNNADLKGKTDRVQGGAYGPGRDKEGGYWDKDQTHSDRRYHNTVHGQQSIQTFTIGFGEGLTEQGKAYLQDAATCTGEKLNRCYFEPSTGEELARVFNVIGDFIGLENTPGIGATYSASTPAVTGSTIAELAATLTLDTGIWSSQLLFAKFDKGTLGKDTQSAIYKNRKVIVNNGTDAPYWLNPSMPAARKADFGIADNAEFTLGFVPWLMRHPTISDTAIESQVNSGVPKENRTVSQYRIRAAEADSPARQMADVIGTPVVAMGSVSDADKKQKYVVTAANDGMVYIFAYDKNEGKYDLTLNYLPAGMQRESHLPPNNPASLTVGKTIRATAEANYGKNDLTNPHVYLNNGGISWVRTPKTGGRNQQDILLGTMGQGGRGAYALAIAGKKRADRSENAAAGLDTASGNWLAEVPLWETEKSQDNMLGYTISTGVIGQVATQWKTGSGASGSAGTPDVNEGVHLYAFLANGYQSGNAEVPYDASPTLYVYDMMGQEFGRKIDKDSNSVANGNTPGKLIRKISVGGKPGALATPTLVDTNLDGLVDFAYAGDQYGDMYRFDLRGAPNQWSVAKLYDGIEDQPITAAPAVYKVDSRGEKYVVVFGTGSDIFDADRKDRKQQVIMGVHDDLSRAPELVAHGGSEIVHQEMEEIPNPLYASNKALPEKIRVFSKVNPFESNHRAWRINLAEAHGEGENITTSERVVTKPQVLTRTAFITTRIYDFKKTEGSLPEGANPEQTCFSKISETQTGGNSWQMAIDVVTGGGPLAGANSSTAKGAYFEFSDTKVDDGSGSGSGGGNTGGGSGSGSGNGSDTPDRVVAAGFSYGALASAPALVDTNSSSSVAFQTNAQGELGYHGEIVGPFSSNPSDPDDAGGGRNPLHDLKKDCIPSKSKPSLLVATGGENTGSGHNNVQTKLVGPPCFESESLIRIDWRQVPL